MFQLTGASFRVCVMPAMSGWPFVPKRPGTVISGVSEVLNQSCLTPARTRNWPRSIWSVA